MVLIFIIFVLIGLIIYSYNTNQSNKYSISFKEGLDLTNIPIVTFTDGVTKFNFLIDTGSSESHISSDAAVRLIGTPIDTEYSFRTSTEPDSISKKIDTILYYKDKEYKIELFVNKPLSESFRAIKQETGVQIHGILGCDFLNQYNYIIDFKRFIICSKK